MAGSLDIICGSSVVSYEDFEIATVVLHEMLRIFRYQTVNLTFTHIQKAWNVLSTRHVFRKQRDQATGTVPEPMHANDDLWRRLQSLSLLDYAESMDRECSDP